MNNIINEKLINKLFEQIRDVNEEITQKSENGILTDDILKMQEQLKSIYDELIIECLNIIPLARYHVLLDTGLLGNRAIDYEDLKQEAALAICRNIKRYDKKKSNLNTFVYNVAYWAIRRYLKKNMMFYCDTCDLNIEITSNNELSSICSFMAILETLTSEERKLINDIYINKRRMDDIASEMKISRDRITIARDRVITKIKTQMNV